jgi:hypothetical protein
VLVVKGALGAMDAGNTSVETIVCWQTDVQWTDREIRDQLDALFAHRVYFATASVRDARAAASLMAEFSDGVRPELRGRYRDDLSQPHRE